MNQATQTITFPNPGAQTYAVAPITLTATATSGLPVSYTVTSGPATVSGSTLTITGVGTVTVQATQAGNTNYSAATPVSDTFTVSPGTPPATGALLFVPMTPCRLVDTRNATGPFGGPSIAGGDLAKLCDTEQYLCVFPPRRQPTPSTSRRSRTQD